MVTRGYKLLYLLNDDATHRSELNRNRHLAFPVDSILQLGYTHVLMMFHCSFFFFSSRRRHTRLQGDWSSDVCSSDLSSGRRSGAASSTSRRADSRSC